MSKPRSKHPKHITKRGNVFYVTATVNGKRISISTGTDSMEIAKEARTRILREAQAGRWANIEEMKQRQPYATLGEVWDAFWRAMVETGQVKPVTARNYRNSLEKIIEESAPKADFDAFSTEGLTKGLINEFERAWLARDGESARATIYSYVHQARGLFSRKALDKAYEKVRLPDLAGFMGATVDKPQRKITLPDDALWAKTLEAQNSWYMDGNPFWICYVLEFVFGLRRGEAAAARWDWFKAYQGERVFEVPQFKTDAVKRVAVHPKVWEMMQGLHTFGGEYILPGRTPTDRMNLIGREFCQALRGLGYDDRFHKPGHTLRKMVATLTRAQHGLDAAQALLGHRQRGTTEEFYAGIGQTAPAMTIDGSKA